MHSVDLSISATADHFRCPTPREVTGDCSKAKPFRVTRLSLSCHAFTHVDAVAHMFAEASTIERTALADVTGPAFVADLRNVASNHPLDAARMDLALAGCCGEGMHLVQGSRPFRKPHFRGSAMIGQT